MAKSQKPPVKRPSLVMAMIQELRNVGGLASDLDDMAPVAVAAAGGGQALLRLYGSRTGARFWSIGSAPHELWEAIASEHQADLRGNRTGPQA